MRPTEYTADRLAALTGRDLWDATRDLCGTGVLDIARLEICARELMRPGWVLVRLVDGDPEYGKWECRDGDCSWRVDADDDDPAVAICRVACIVALRESDKAEHPADDAEPLTGDWLRSVGFANRAFPDHGNPLCIKVGLTGLLAVWTNGATRLAIRGYYEPAAECSTRGDVRRLCAALGVELKGGE